MARQGANISMITLGVADLVKSTDFYEAMGWVNSSSSQEGVRFLIGHDIVLGLYGRAALAEDAATKDTPTGFPAFSLAINFETEEDVDAHFARAIAAGAHPQKKPEKVFWGGYSGYFADPDGHLWEVAHNPFLQMDANGKWQLEPAA